MSAFCWPARVYWEDTDGGAIVYYANYLRFLERSRTEWLRAHGHSQQRAGADPGHPVRGGEPAGGVPRAGAARRRAGDHLRAARAGRGLAALHAAHLPQGTRRRGACRGLLLEAQVRVACVDARSLKPRRLPQFLLAAVAAQEAAHG